MIQNIYNLLLSESITSDLKKKHSNKEWFSIAVAPTSKTKYYKQILIFYKETDYDKEERYIGVWFKDVEVYALKHKTDECDNLGHFDEFFYSSSTYCAYLKNKKLTIFNCVSNTKTDIGNFDTIDSEMRSKLRNDSRSLAKGTFSIKSTTSELEGAIVVGKASGYVLYEKNGKRALYTKDEKQVLSWREHLKIGAISRKMISAEETNGYTLFSIDGRKIASSYIKFDLYKSYGIVEEGHYKNRVLHFYNEEGKIGHINNIEGVLNIISDFYDSPVIGLYTELYKNIRLKIFEAIDLDESETLSYLKNREYFLNNIINSISKRLFQMIFEDEKPKKFMEDLIKKINLKKLKNLS